MTNNDLSLEYLCVRVSHFMLQADSSYKMDIYSEFKIMCRKEVVEGRGKSGGNVRDLAQIYFSETKRVWGNRSPSDNKAFILRFCVLKAGLASRLATKCHVQMLALQKDFVTLLLHVWYKHPHHCISSVVHLSSFWIPNLLIL